MKNLILLISILIISSGLYAQKQTSIEIIGGGFIHHVYHKENTPPPHRYYNKLKTDLVKPLFGLRYYEEYENWYKSISVFYTKNCIGKDQIGGICSYGNKTNFGKFNLLYGGVIGFYTENQKDWDNKYMDCSPVVIFNCLTPVLGAEINLRYNLSSKYYISLNTMVSLIIHTSLSIGVKI